MSASSIPDRVVRSMFSEVQPLCEGDAKTGRSPDGCPGTAGPSEDNVLGYPPAGSIYDHGPHVPFIVLNSSHAPSPSPADVLST